MKVRQPNKIILLRGTHEVIDDSEVNDLLFEDCKAKFGDEEMFDVFFETMNAMPFSAVVSGSVFCAFSGIPKPNLRTNSRITVLNNISKEPS